MKYKYLRGSKDSREVFEFDISKRGQYITTCVVDVDLLLCGIKTFPCGNGDDFKLTGQQQLDILELVAAERRKITSGIEIKTMESWYGSGLNFEDYCFPGDTVGEDIVDYFVNVVPPVTLRYDCVQAGELPHLLPLPRQNGRRLLPLLRLALLQEGGGHPLPERTGKARRAAKAILNLPADFRAGNTRISPARFSIF